ncbi:hypothetical protein [Variovorax sp. PAMC 28711]|uniref:hypothetical protein n=1 Tax=Variovorax sp. PAMC 28711 TaxID=1795631 RepID=UPI00078B3331|nr:hypothetical protein [Variovorax sp. PAMC 28711]AMM25711.1 hypothetical protein AX767_16105 [Variovorax sp. PAMC 28711]
MDDLLPMPRLNAKQLRALAVSVRSRAAGGAQVADSVAAALESVSRHRENRPWKLASNAAMSLVAGITRSAVTVLSELGQLSMGLLGFARSHDRADAQTTFRLVEASRARTPHLAAAIDLTPALICSTLTAVEQGGGMPPEQCDALVARGWAKWVDGEFGTPVGMNDERSMLRLTSEGRDRLTCELIASTL